MTMSAAQHQDCGYSEEVPRFSGFQVLFPGSLTMPSLALLNYQPLYMVVSNTLGLPLV